MESSTSQVRGAVAACLFAVAALAAILLPGDPVGAAAAPPPMLPAPDSHGIDLTSWVPAPNDDSPASDWRFVDATMKTGAVYVGRAPYAVRVRILLPPNYDANPDRQAPYDVLYLLHGGSGTYDDWRNAGNVEALVKASDFEGIVVMPEAGATGYYTDWWGASDGGFKPAWETFHIGQLLPWVDANFNTKATREGRAIAGPSMGGFGTLTYAGQHADKFGAAGAMSGGADMGDPAAQALFTDHMWMGGACIRNPGFPGIGNCWDGAMRVNLYENGVLVLDQERQKAYRVETVFGPESNFPNVNPWDMAANYAAYDGKLALYSGGLPDGETGIGQLNLAFHNLLNQPQLDVEHRWCVGSGGHDWSFWQKDLTDFLAFVYSDEPLDCHYATTPETPT